MMKKMPKVPVKGIISSEDDAEVYEFFGYSTVTPSDIDTALSNAAGADITVEINSPGGDVFAGSEIFTALKNYQGNVEVDIVGLAASAASIIAMSGKPIKISPTAQLMIHRAATVSQGNADDLASDLAGLDSTDQAIVGVYQTKTGLDPQTIYQMMSKETWINAQEAVKQGFADEVMFAEAPKITNSTEVLLSDDVIAKVKTLMRKVQEKNEPEKVNKQDSQLNDKLAILFEQK